MVFCFALPAGMLLQSETKIEPDLRLHHLGKTWKRVSYHVTVLYGISIQASYEGGFPTFQLGEIFPEAFGEREKVGLKCILSGQGEKFSHEDSRLSNLLSM